MSAQVSGPEQEFNIIKPKLGCTYPPYHCTYFLQNAPARDTYPPCKRTYPDTYLP